MTFHILFASLSFFASNFHFGDFGILQIGSWLGSWFRNFCGVWNLSFGFGLQIPPFSKNSPPNPGQNPNSRSNLKINHRPFFDFNPWFLGVLFWALWAKETILSQNRNPSHLSDSSDLESSPEILPYFRPSPSKRRNLLLNWTFWSSLGLKMANFWGFGLQNLRILG